MPRVGVPHLTLAPRVTRWPQRYVDFYTSHLTNFLAYPADYRFSPPRRLMPHQNPVRSGVGAGALSYPGP